MKGNRLFATGFWIFHYIIQEEVDQDGVARDFRMLASDLSPDELDAPDTAAYTSRQSHMHAWSRG